jgi:hypothetical protein
MIAMIGMWKKTSQFFYQLAGNDDVLPLCEQTATPARDTAICRRREWRRASVHLILSVSASRTRNANRAFLENKEDDHRS